LQNGRKLAGEDVLYLLPYKGIHQGIFVLIVGIEGSSVNIGPLSDVLNTHRRQPLLLRDFYKRLP
jgi:hypothetical protein